MTGEKCADDVDGDGVVTVDIAGADEDIVPWTDGDNETEIDSATDGVTTTALDVPAIASSSEELEGASELTDCGLGDCEAGDFGMSCELSVFESLDEPKT